MKINLKEGENHLVSVVGIIGALTKKQAGGGGECNLLHSTPSSKAMDDIFITLLETVK